MVDLEGLEAAVRAGVWYDDPNNQNPPSRVSRAVRSAAAQHYNEMHGLIVAAGKLHCHKQAPKCEGCPLQPFLPH